MIFAARLFDAIYALIQNNLAFLTGIGYVALLPQQDPNISSGILALLRVTRSLLDSTVKYVLKAPSKSTSNEHSTIKKVKKELSSICLCACKIEDHNT